MDLRDADPVTGCCCNRATFRVVRDHYALPHCSSCRLGQAKIVYAIPTHSILGFLFPELYLSCSHAHYGHSCSLASLTK